MVNKKKNKKYKRYSKLKIYRTLLNSSNELIIDSLPETKKFTDKNLRRLLSKYDEVIIKPKFGRKGKRIVKVTKVNNQYKLHYLNEVKTYKSYKQLLLYLQETFRIKGYIIQQYIPLVTIEGNPVDVRVMVQPDEESKQIMTGMVAKIAGSGFFVTNNCLSQGKAVSMEYILEHSCLKDNPGCSDIPKRIEGLSIVVSDVLVDQLVEGYRKKIGLDIGLDHTGKPWIIEVNFNPGISLFKKLEDKTMYQKIRKYLRKSKKI